MTTGFNFSAAFLRVNINIKILLASLKTPTNSKDFTESRIRILFQLPLSFTGRFSLVPNPYWMQENSG
jgi:hypothetical protein